MSNTLTKDEMRAEALSRATNGQSFANYPAIVSGFIAKGIAPSEIEPRVNVFTYNAWLAKGRQVRKGEKGVKVVTFIVIDDDDEKARKMAKTTTVFHISQTDQSKDHASVCREPYLPPKKPAKYDPRGWVRGVNCGDVRDPGEVDADAWSASHSADR